MSNSLNELVQLRPFNLHTNSRFQKIQNTHFELIHQIEQPHMYTIYVHTFGCCNLRKLFCNIPFKREASEECIEQQQYTVENIIRRKRLITNRFTATLELLQEKHYMHIIVHTYTRNALVDPKIFRVGVIQVCNCKLYSLTPQSIQPCMYMNAQYLMLDPR